MNNMTQRERFLSSLLGKKTDRFPFFDLEPDEETIRRWQREGLPRGQTVASYFNLESHHSCGLNLNSYPFYSMTPGILDDPSIFHKHYNPDQPARYARNFVKRCEHLRREGRVVYVDASGGGLLQKLGVGNWDSLRAACYALVRRPQVVEELVDRVTDFYCICLERVLSNVSVDYASFYEPIAANTGPVISPAMFERFAIPGYRKVIDLLKRHEVPLRILCTTGGDLTPLLPALIEAGINGFWISNICSASMQYEQLRQQFGPRIALIGGIDASALALDASAIRIAVKETVPGLLADGRYLPCLDDRPRSNVPLSNYRLYRQILEEISHGC
jgi:hypothetical protein